jgi:hypothetical protein
MSSGMAYFTPKGHILPALLRAKFAAVRGSGETRSYGNDYAG